MILVLNLGIASSTKRVAIDSSLPEIVLDRESLVKDSPQEGVMFRWNFEIS
jgi:hypothetical protein